MRGKLWSREELILSMNLYCKLEYGKIDSKTPEIIALANFTGRSPNSIALRLANFVSCDPQLKAKGIKGLDGGLAQCQPIWDEFFQKNKLLAQESDRIFRIMKIANLSISKHDNIVNVIDQEIIWKRIVSVLAAKNKINYSGSNPYYIVIGTSPYFVFIRNLTRAYPFESPDVCRIQLHKSAKFGKVKQSITPLVVLGYCEQYDTFASWSSESVKPRLNGKGNVSLYSRFSAQTPLKKGKQREFKLNNGEIVSIINFEDIELLFTKNSVENCYPIVEVDLFSIINKVEETTEDYFEKGLFSLLADTINDTSEFDSIQICISYFEKHNREYNLLTIKNIIAKFKEMMKLAPSDLY